MTCEHQSTCSYASSNELCPFKVTSSTNGTSDSDGINRNASITIHEEYVAIHQEGELPNTTFVINIGVNLSTACETLETLTEIVVTEGKKSKTCCGQPVSVNSQIHFINRYLIFYIIVVDCWTPSNISILSTGLIVWFVTAATLLIMIVLTPKFYDRGTYIQTYVCTVRKYKHSLGIIACYV